MVRDMYFEGIGLGPILDRLYQAFPAFVQVDYLDICGIEREAIIDSPNAERLRALGSFLALLHEGEYLFGNFYESAEIRYYWECQLTIQGFSAIQRWVNEGKGPLCGPAVFSLFEHVAV